MKHLVIRWNSATQEYFCQKCGRTSKEVAIQDAREKLERYECEIPSVDTASPARAETVGLIKKSSKS
jgi:C4-type Zn-finger protein